MNSRIVMGLALVTTAAVAACSKSASTSAPTPATSPSASSAPAAPAVAAKPFTAAMVAKGAANGPTLITTNFMHVNGTYDDFVRIITTGIPATAIKDAAHRIPMPAMGGPRPAPLTDAQVKSVAAYVYSLNHP